MSSSANPTADAQAHSRAAGKVILILLWPVYWGAHQASGIQAIYKRFAPCFREILSNKELSEQKKKKELQELEDDREVLIRKQLDDEEYEKFKRLVRAGWRPGPAGR